MSVVQYGFDADRIAWIKFNDPAAPGNLFGADLLNELEITLDELAQHQPAAVIFTSGKSDSFLGDFAPVVWDGLRAASFAADLARGGQRVLGKIEQLGVPTVAAIHGACVGAGCELALACRHRVATDDPATSLGLPATRESRIPAWGGTQRLPRLIGLRRALDLIVTGRCVGAVEALELGVVDQICLPRDLATAATTLCRAKRPRLPWRYRLQNLPPGRAWLSRQARRRAAGPLVAPVRAIAVMEQGLAKSLPVGLELEASAFSELAFGGQRRQLAHVAALCDQSAQWMPPRGTRLPVFRKVGVVGAGPLGAAIAQWCAAQGLIVRFRDETPSLVAAGMKRIAAANAGWTNMRPTTDWTGFGNCEVIIEAVAGDARREVWREMARVAGRECVFATVAPDVDWEEFTATTDRPGLCLGLYFAEPVGDMELAEVARGPRTAAETAIVAMAFAQRLRKLPVAVAGGVASALRRRYLAETTALLNEGVAGRQIDAAMVAFGFPAGPVPFAAPATVKPARTKYPPEWIQKRLLEALIAEARRCLRERWVAGDDDLDAVSVFGLGFPAWLGGVAAYAKETRVWHN